MQRPGEFAVVAIVIIDYIDLYFRGAFKVRDDDPRLGARLTDLAPRLPVSRLCRLRRSTIGGLLTLLSVAPLLEFRPRARLSRHRAASRSAALT